MINISRRGFLGGLLASGASALIGPSLLGRAVMAAESGEKLVQSGSHWGAFRARVVDGRWVETLPFEHDKHPTEMLKALSEVVYNPSRIRYPMVRLDWLRKGHQSDTSERGHSLIQSTAWYAESVRRFPQVSVTATGPAVARDWPSLPWRSSVAAMAGS